jgi:predicted HicB family RNase H-like nuclease
MVATKTATLNLRIDPVLKEVLRNAAAREHRSVANMVEQLIRVHCSERGIKITDLREMSPRARQD